MKKSLLIAMLTTLCLIGGAAAAVASSEASENAHHMQWVTRSDVVHVFVFGDEGRPDQPPAIVSGGSPLRFGFEWGDSLEALQSYIDDPDHDILMSVDGGPWESVKSGYQSPFVPTPGEGPRWSWDHDGDGLGDGNGNGIGDWDFPVLFWRFAVNHLEKGTHTIDFGITFDGGATFDIDTITAVVG